MLYVLCFMFMFVFVFVLCGLFMLCELVFGRVGGFFFGREKKEKEKSTKLRMLFECDLGIFFCEILRLLFHGFDHLPSSAPSIHPCQLSSSSSFLFLSISLKPPFQSVQTPNQYSSTCIELFRSHLSHPLPRHLYFHLPNPYPNTPCQWRRTRPFPARCWPISVTTGLAASTQRRRRQSKER